MKGFELILTVKMETRHPVEGQFGSEFPAICNHCAVMTTCSRKVWKFCEQFLRFFWKTTLFGKNFKNSVPKVYMATPTTLKCRKIRRNHALFTGRKQKQNFGCLSNCRTRYYADRAQNLDMSSLFLFWLPNDIRFSTHLSRKTYLNFIFFAFTYCIVNVKSS